MAIARMLKTTVIGHRPALRHTLAVFQQQGVLDVVANEFDLPSEEIGPEDERRLLIDEQLADASFVRDFLSRYHTSNTPLKTFVTEKFHLSEERFIGLEFDAHVHRIYRECVAIADRLAAGERECDRLRQLIHDLEPWGELRLQISQWQGTERTILFAGTVPAASGTAIRQQLREAVGEVTVEELGPVGDRQAWVVIVCHAVVDEVRSVLAATDFADVSFPGLEDYPAEERARAQATIVESEEEAERLKERAVELAQGHYAAAVALVRALESNRDSLLLHESIAGTERAFVLRGWTRAASRDALEAGLARFGDSTDLTFDDPGEDDEPPVALENHWLIRPFELLTDLYGRPRYRGVDPTPLHAPFFVLFFGLCIGDVGYGLMLIGGALLIKHRLDVTAGVKRFMDLLVIGGVASMVVGVLLGSYLALPVDSLPPALQSLQVLDPIGDIQQFLLFALALGVIQVFFGVFIAAWSAFRHGDPESAVFDHLSIVFLFVMLTVTALAGVAGSADIVRASLMLGLVGAMVMQGRAVQAAMRGDGVAKWDRLVGIMWAAVFVGGMVVYALTGALSALWVALGLSVLGLAVSKAVRRGVVGVLAGAYNVYGLTGFVGDVLSYLRLPALGLSGALVGSVFNILTSLVWTSATPLFAEGGIAWLGGAVVAVLAVAVFAVGHTFNVVINLLGAFVHPTRLQFVEFFSKFYEAGGRPFAPFGFRTDGLVLDAGAAGKEGGRVS
ncbi:MAG: V-type ATPase 116kDa subunit family protein [Coriobacteriia bacterium]|nr:V-type ATPase 116kDa subunit family protein [Coriobacteriia bacterium]